MGQHSRFLIKESPCTLQKGTPGLTFMCCLLQSAFTRANITCEMYLTDFEQKASGDLSYEMVGFSYITWVFVYSETDMLCIHTTKTKKKTKKTSILLKVDNTIQYRARKYNVDYSDVMSTAINLRLNQNSPYTSTLKL